MPFKCCAMNCKTGYDNEKPPAVSAISLFRFPKDPVLVAEWRKRISRENWEPRESSRICSLHFREEDIIREKQDSNTSRTKSGSQKASLRPRLRAGAIPTIFEDLPSYKNVPVPEERTSAPRVSAESRRKADEQRQEENIEKFFAEDAVRTVDDILKMTQEEVLPEGFIPVNRKNCCCFFYVLAENSHEIPQLLASLTIMEDMTFSVSVLGKLIRPSKFQQLLEKEGKFCLFSEVANVLSAIKNMTEESEKIDWLDIAEDCLSQFLNLEEISEELRRRIEFVTEQLSLAQRKPGARRYSPELVITSFLLHAAGPQAYRQLLEQNRFVLPSERTLRKLTKSIGTSSTADTDKYLKLRIEKLAEHERTVTLVVDEIYIAKRVEYSAPQGQVIGLTPEENAQAGTVLCFMVCSLLGKYQDIVALYPVGRLTVKKLQMAFMEVMERVTGLGFHVVASVMDNHVVNRNFYTELCGGQLKPQIRNPFGREPLFLLFDTVHNFKNIFNNFQKRRDFGFPVMPGSGVTEAHFGDIQDLFARESQKPLKLAHKLSEKVISPNAVRKASVQVANSLFHESTRDALLWFSENEGTQWYDTAEFVNYVLTFWKIVNVRSPTTGQRKRDEDREPVRSTDDEKLNFLLEFADWLERWKEHSPAQRGLSYATFLANIHTCRTLVEVSRYCIDELGFEYVLLGKFQSDPLEGRFGWYRQLSGGNYYISLRQVLDNERKIKAVSLLRMSKCSLAEMAEIGRLEDVDTPRLVQEKALELQQSIQIKLDTELNTVDSSDANAVGYVAGALVRSELRLRKCQQCSELLKDTNREKLPEIPLSTLDELGGLQPVTKNILSFVNEVNRGGLLAPSTLASSIGLKCWSVFNCIDNCKELQSEILSSSNQQMLFVALVEGLLEEDVDFEEIAVPKLECSGGHKFGRSLIRRFFNCIAKNWVKRLSGDGTGGQSMKIAKLQSHW